MHAVQFENGAILIEDICFCEYSVLPHYLTICWIGR